MIKRRLVSAGVVCAAVAAIALANPFGDDVFSGGGVGGAGVSAYITAYSEAAEGGADSLSVGVIGRFVVPVQIAVDYRVTATTAGSHPTADTTWTEVVDTTGQAAATRHDLIAEVGHFTATGDTIGVRWRVFAGGALVQADSLVTTSTASYWRWWNYAFAACVTADDGEYWTMHQLDSLMTARGLEYTAFVNPVHAAALSDETPPISAGARSSPAQIKAMLADGGLDLGSHALTANSIWNVVAPSGWNDGGLVSNADVAMLEANGLWSDLGMDTLWTGDPDHVGSIAGYYDDDHNVLDGFGILVDESDSTWTYSPWTIGQHLQAEIERDYFVSLGLLDTVDDVRVYAYSQYRHNSDAIQRLIVEGYIGARSSAEEYDGSYGDLGDPHNAWGNLSIYRVPLLCNVSTLIDSHPIEATVRARVDSVLTAQAVVDSGGLYAINVHETAEFQPNSTYMTPEELAYYIEQIQTAGGIIPSFTAAVEYYRERSVYVYDINGDIVWTTRPYVADEQVAVFAASMSDRTGGSNDSDWPDDRDLEVTDVAHTVLAASREDSTNHKAPTTRLEMVLNETFSTLRSYSPDFAALWFDLDQLPADVDVTSADLHGLLPATGAWNLALGATDSVHFVMSHVPADTAWPNGASGTTPSDANSSWELMDVSDAESGWTPNLHQRFWDRSLGTRSSITNTTLSLDNWYEFDITDGVEAIVEDGQPNGGLFILGDAAANDDYFGFFHWDAAGASACWVEVRYRQTFEPIATVGERGETVASGPSTTPPGAPIGLVATADTMHVDLDWVDRNEGDLAGYYVEILSIGDGGWDRINTGLLTESEWDGSVFPLVPTIERSFRVVAIDTLGNESEPSNVASATPLWPADTTPPVIDSFSLTFADSAGAGGTLRFNGVLSADESGVIVARVASSPVGVAGADPETLATAAASYSGLITSDLEPFEGEAFASVTVTDDAGNTSNPATDSIAVVRQDDPGDITPPVATLADTTWADPLVQFDWTFDEAAYVAFRLRGTGEAWSDTATADTTATATRIDYDATALSEGDTVHVWLTAEDAAGNTSDPVTAYYVLPSSGGGGSTRVIASARVYMHTSVSQDIAVCAWDEAGDLIGQSQVVTTGGGDWITLTWAAADEVTVGDTVRIGVFGSAATFIGEEEGAAACTYASGLTSTAPDPIPTGSASGTIGQMSVYLADSGGDLIAGTDTQFPQGGSCGVEAWYWYTAGYTVQAAP
jgi:hypothetical protein